MSLSIAIVLYKNPQTQIVNLLNDIFLSQEINLLQVYLIDNSPTNELNNLTGMHPKLRYIKMPYNLGYAKAHNLAMNLAYQLNPHYHLVLNPDIRFGPYVLAKISQYMEENLKIGLLMPKILYPDGNIQYLCKRLPSPTDILARFVLKGKYLVRFNYKYCLKFTGYNKLMPVAYLSGCFMFLRTQDLITYGGFDERFFMYFEDTDLSRRFFIANKAWFYPEVSVIHEHNQESFRSIKMFFIHLQSFWRYFNKYGWFYDSLRKSSQDKPTI